MTVWLIGLCFRYSAQIFAEPKIFLQRSPYLYVDSRGEEVSQLEAVSQHAQDVRDEDKLKDLLATINETLDPQPRAAFAQSYNSLKHALERQREYAQQETKRSREANVRSLRIIWSGGSHGARWLPPCALGGLANVMRLPSVDRLNTFSHDYAFTW